MTHATTDRPYLYTDLTNSLCSQCLKKVEAKIIVENDCVYLDKICLTHGREKVLISTDVAYYQQCRQALKPGQMPARFNTETLRGCPFDCGLCPDHEQHSCLCLIEVTERCNLACPICYADSGPTHGQHRSLAQIEFMVDELVKNEVQPDIVQLSGGEPTIHPQFFDILDMMRRKPIRHLMINTNGVRLAQDKAFVDRLATYAPGLEIYLQFDSFRPEVLQAIRGQDLTAIRQEAINHLNAVNLSTTLVAVVEKGRNDDEIGAIIDYALKQPCVRGVTFQPVQSAGRVENFDPAVHRLTLSEVRQGILQQHSLFTPQDLMPVPCHPECITMGYALKLGDQTLPISTFMDPQVLLGDAKNTIVFEHYPASRQRLEGLFSLGVNCEATPNPVQHLLCCMPGFELPQQLNYDNIFRVIIMEFMDAYNFDVRSVKRSCVHIAHPDGRIIPFDTYNLFYRGA